MKLQQFPRILNAVGRKLFVSMTGPWQASRSASAEPHPGQRPEEPYPGVYALLSGFERH